MLLNITNFFFLGNSGNIKFNGDWTAFIESLLQVHLLKLDTRDLYAIKYLFKLIISPGKQNYSSSSHGMLQKLIKNIL